MSRRLVAPESLQVTFASPARVVLVGVFTYGHHAYRAPLAFKAIMTLPQPSAFLSLLRGCEGECPALQESTTTPPLAADGKPPDGHLTAVKVSVVYLFKQSRHGIKT